jgi:hypothetical protein
VDENTLLQRPHDAVVEPAEEPGRGDPQRPPDAGDASQTATAAGRPATATSQAAQEPEPGAETSPEQVLNAEGGQAGAPGFAERGRMRRRARFLRKARELAYRDLGGLVFDLHRFGQRNDVLVLGKLDTIGRIDGELRTLENGLAERQPVTVLREAGIAACPRCAAIHGSDDRFCPHCGLAMNVNAERPVAGSAAPTGAYPGPPAPAQPSVAPLAPAQSAVPGPAPVQAPGSTPAPSALPPAGPAPGVADGDSGRAEDRPGADQPTEIIRPPRRET